MKFLRNDKGMRELERILKLDIILRTNNERYDFFKDRLTEEGRKILHRELKDKARREKLFTEIYFLYKFAHLNFKVDKPEKGDVLAQDNSITFKIEVYQPDVSRSKFLKEIERKALIRRYEEYNGNVSIWKGYTIALNSEQLLKEIVSESIMKKRANGQLTKEENTINILCVDLSDRSLTERLELLDPDLQEYFDLGELKTILDDWEELNGLILSVWIDELMTEKIGFLINKDIDEQYISILSQVVLFVRVI